MSGRGGDYLAAWRCERGHLQLHAGVSCAACGRALRTSRVPSGARLVAVTTVRVNPRGRPFVLGVAVTACGHARTLCVVEGAIRGNGRDAVRLHIAGGVVVARAAGRIRERSREPVSTPEDSRRS